MWFNADTSRTFDNMTRIDSEHYRTSVHPLFSILTYPSVGVLKAFGLSDELAVKTLVATIAGLWLAVQFIVFRAIGLKIFDAALFVVLSATTSATVFWIHRPDLYSFGSLSILLVVFIAATMEKRRVSPWLQMVVCALSMSVTITNWMAGIFQAFIYNKWKAAFRIVGGSFVIVALGWAVERFIFPTAGFFLNVASERRFIVEFSVQALLKRLSVFFANGVVMPDKIDFREGLAGQIPTSSISDIPIFSYDILGYIAIPLWILLFILGIYSMYKFESRRRFCFFLSILILGQLGLHMVYGGEVFLHTAHWIPLLIVVAATSACSGPRRIAIALVVPLIILAGINNIYEFSNNMSLYKNSINEVRIK